MMKKKVFLMLFLGMFLYSSAQVVDIYGTGAESTDSSKLCFCSPTNVTTVIADVHYKHSTIDANGPTELCNCDGDNNCLIQACEYDYNASSAEPFTGYFRHTFNNVNQAGVKEIALLNKPGIESFFLFVLRDLPAPTHYSVYNTDNVFFFRNGIDDPFVYNLPINTASSERTVIVTIPISELNNDDRQVIIDVTAGSVTAHREFEHPNMENSLNLTPIVLKGVGGDVTNVAVSIYSPDGIYPDCGDSFITGGAVVDVLSDKHCTFTQGFYGNYGGLVCGAQTTYDLMYGLLFNDLVIGGGDNTLTLTRDGTGEEGSGDGVDCLIGRLPGGGKPAVLNGAATCDDPVGIKIHKRNGRFKNSLLAQTITLGLNLRHDVNLGRVQLENNVMLTTAAADCSDPETGGVGPSVGYKIGRKVINYLGADNTIDDLFALANAALAGDNICPLKLGNITHAIAAINEGFDECRLLDGFISSCKKDSEAGVTYEEYNALKVYPNPVSDICHIDFASPEDGNTTVEIYNIMGERMDVLFDEPTAEDERYAVDFYSQSYPAGIYFIIVRTGNSLQKQKVSIVK